jgi:hypothetical protein
LFMRNDANTCLFSVSSLSPSPIKNRITERSTCTCSACTEQSSHFQTGTVMEFCLSALYATCRIRLISLVTCLPSYRTMVQYFEFLYQFYSFHMTHLWDQLNKSLQNVRLFITIYFSITFCKTQFIIFTFQSWLRIGSWYCWPQFNRECAFQDSYNHMSSIINCEISDFWNVIPSTVVGYTTWHHVPDDSHQCENLQSHLITYNSEH